MWENNKAVLENIKACYEDMFAAEKKAADFIIHNPERAVMMNVSELSRLSNVSDATVLRMCKRIGYEGYYQMKIKLSNDLGKNQFLRLKDGKPKPESPKDLFQILALNMLKIAETLDMDALAASAELIRQADMVHIAAVGNTSPLALNLGFRLGRCGIRTSCSTLPEHFLNNISLAGETDVLVAISHSGTSKQVIQALDLGRGKKIKSIVVTGHEYSPVSNMADYLLLAWTDTPIFGGIEPESHLGELAVLDALLYFLINGKSSGAGIDSSVELILSEYKL
ncbi:MAG: MurR/RpiR family transcriptional regulator [Treponema sp.]|jgi:DNA-binding MurR/RpiR family transcriptional regulator|nr:MurR/RpiR family transcriptional regulator [Treponema sp.]